MTIVSPAPPLSPDAVSLVVGERGVILRAMSGVEADTPSTTPTTPPLTPQRSKPQDGHDDNGGESVAGVEDGVVPVSRGRRKLENEDSSYDSDFEPCERPEDDQHDDVCRTVSDTLGAEFAEYVTKLQPPPPSTATTTTTTITTSATTTTAATTTTTAATTTTTAASSPAPTTTTVTITVTTKDPIITSTTSTTTTTTTSTPSVSVTPPSTLPTVTLTQPPKAPISDTGVGTRAWGGEEGHGVGVSWVIQRPSYPSQVEFGVKLGYSEALVQLALVKLGGSPDKDELLAELIRLGTTSAKAEGDSEAGEDLGDGKDDHEPQAQQLQQPQQTPQSQTQPQQSALKPVIIDGSNVAMSHGNKTTFSCRGLRVCVEWFRARGHTEITVFVPKWRKEAPRWDTPIADQEVLLELERERVLVFTPSRVCGGKRIVSYDDRYILNEALTSGGVVVSNDNYRDLAAESLGFRRVVEESLLMYSWVNGRFVPPDDPLGRTGPTLDVFLRRSARDKQAPCPYGRKCTYGNKCKYMHPERGTAPLKSVTERLQEQAQRHYQNKAAKSRDSSPGEGLRGKSLSLPVGVADSDIAKKPLARTQSIVPKVSLTLPSALTQETPTHDHSPPTSSHHHLMPPSLDPMRSATIFKSDSSLYTMYPSQGPASYGASALWWDRQQGAEVPLRTPQQGQQSSYNSHMPAAKQLSDPDTSDNPHRKLQRQLTLNPAFDSRLYKIHGFQAPAPEHFTLAGSLPSQGQQGSPSRGVSQSGEAAVFPPQGRASPGYSSPYNSREQLPVGLHPPLARPGSQEGSKHLASLPPHFYPAYTHPQVTRFRSAPDPIWGSPQQQAAPGPPHITRLNSTSDTRLNVCGGGDSQYLSDVFEDQPGRLPSYPVVGPSSGPSAPSPGPVGSRPMSPQGPALHHSPSVSPRQQTPPQQAQQTGGQGPPATTFPPPSHEDTRLRVFYHLFHLFPEAQVRAVMAQHPEETDPQKICSYILASSPSPGPAGPGPGGSRPMSPQQGLHQGPGYSYLLQGFPTLLQAPASHEDARFRAFYHLSQLFPEVEVRAVLARYPDETDTQQFCASLLARRSTS